MCFIVNDYGEAISTFLLRILWSDPKLSEICLQWPRSRRAQEDEERGATTMVLCCQGKCKDCD
jgi:hypothetical protein